MNSTLLLDFDDFQSCKTYQFRLICVELNSLNIIVYLEMMNFDFGSTVEQP
jgi:hypothetical protein